MCMLMRRNVRGHLDSIPRFKSGFSRAVSRVCVIGRGQVGGKLIVTSKLQHNSASDLEPESVCRNGGGTYI